MLMRLHGHEICKPMRKPFLRYCAVVPLTQSHRTGGTRVNDANRFSENRADKAIWVEARKQQQPLASFRMRFSRARDIFMMRYRVHARVYSGV